MAYTHISFLSLSRVWKPFGPQKKLYRPLKINFLKDFLSYLSKSFDGLKTLVVQIYLLTCCWIPLDPASRREKKKDKGNKSSLEDNLSWIGVSASSRQPNLSCSISLRICLFLVYSKLLNIFIFNRQKRTYPVP